MKIVSLDAIPVSVPYRLRETSAIIDRGGVSDVIVKLVTDTGLVGWGEACKATDTLALERGVRACAPFLVARDPWEHEAILADIYKRGLWYLQPMFGNSILAGIDMALWDLCGKDCGQPLYKMLGGARRPSVNYAHYVRWDQDPSTVAEHAREGIERGYSVFYMKAGVDEAVEERTLETVRGVIGPTRKIRIDCNQAWSVPTAIRLINRWHQAFDLDFVEAPVPHEPIERMTDVRRAVTAPLAANEGLWRESDVVRMIRARCADYLCFGPHLVGSIRRFVALMHLGDLEGMQLCKHSRGELGICASAAHQVMLAAPNACLGQQQNAGRLSGDVVRTRIPITDEPDWGTIELPGIGVEVDEDRVRAYHENFLRSVDFTPFGDQRR
jgi:L-alanine-DL-glutamate epimerase-like enolase superfamily enzyme